MVSSFPLVLGLFPRAGVDGERAVGRARGVPTLDLPHAETANAESLEGLDFDRIGVFGPRSATVLREAGFPAERIAEIGAPHFDELRV